MQRMWGPLLSWFNYFYNQAQTESWKRTAEMVLALWYGPNIYKKLSMEFINKGKVYLPLEKESLQNIRQETWSMQNL